MKFDIIFLVVFSLFLDSFQIQISNLPITPKASDLNNHYGTNPSANIYGPHHYFNDIPREGVNLHSKISSIQNLEDEIIPQQVTSGNLMNTAVDASKIIEPLYATPKLVINSNFNHNTIVETPIQLGIQKEERQRDILNKIDGQVDSQQVTVEKPIVGLVKNLRNVNTKHQTIIDLKTGKQINNEPKIGYVGV